MDTTIKVVGSRALVKRLDNPLESETIEVVQFAEEPSQFAMVLAVGPGDKLDNGRVIPMEVQPGEIVIIKKLCGTPVLFKGMDCHFVTRGDLLAVLD
jgi:chaperonin GroES